MSGVLGRPTLKRQDIIISTASDQSIGFRWWRSHDGGRTREPVDLAGYTGTAELRSIDGTSWASLPLEVSTSSDDPIVILTTTPVMFSGPEWSARRSGEYAFILSSATGDLTVLMSGYIYLER